MEHYFIFNGESSADFGVWISGGGTYDAPARDVQTEAIPGRNGAATFDNGRFENIQLTYPAFISRRFQPRVDGFRAFLLSQKGYQRLEDTYHPNEYRLALFHSGLTVETTPRNLAGSFDITFDCKPQRFLKSGDEPVPFYAKGIITNPTLFESLPVIAVTGNGRVNVAGHLFTVSDTTQTIYIDSELMEVYIPGHELVPLTEENDLIIRDELWLPIEIHKGNRDAINMNSHVSFADYDFPRIGPGEQPVAFDSGIESLVIYPRWWRL